MTNIGEVTPDKSIILAIVDHNPEFLSLLDAAAIHELKIEFTQSFQETILAINSLNLSKFALIILDLQLTSLDGIEIARHIRQNSQSRGTPILFLTSNNHSDLELLKIDEPHTAINYLLKPIDFHLLISKIKIFTDLDQKSKALSIKLKEVERLKERADSANIAKGMFLANMSHEIRTPLGSILGFAELLGLSKSRNEEEFKVCIDGILRNGRMLQAMIDDVLDLSKIDAKAMTPDLQMTSFIELIRDIRATHAHNAHIKGLRFEINLVSRLPITIYTDATLIRQVLNNIVGNAVKFTSSGFVQIGVNYDGPTGMLKFSVQDSGVGIYDHIAENLFKSFQQGDPTIRRVYGGTGLGLVLAKRLSGLLGGDVTLDKTESFKGSTFTASIFVGRILDDDLIGIAEMEDGLSRSLLPSEQDSEILRGVRVLVVDDVEDNRFFVSKFLEMAGAVVTTANGGYEAIKLVDSHEFSLILMDIQMPEIDGFAAMKAIRRKGIDVKIIALTAHAMKDEAVRSLEEGFDAYLCKPISINNLIEKVSKMIVNPNKA
jgi:signal transduction histidine kinase